MLQKLRDKVFLTSLQLESSANKIAMWQYILLGILVYFCCYYGMASYAILDMNEGLYAEVAREMMVNHHFIIPYLNDVPYLEKPPLLYWLISLSYQIFGINVFAARIVPSTFLALTCLSVLYVGKKLEVARTGFIAAIILLTSLVFIMIGRVVFFDMMLTFFISASLFSFYFWTQSETRKDLYIVLSYIFLGLAVLSKGLMAIVIVPFIMLIFLFLMKSERAIYRELFNKKALIAFCIVVLPWHILAMVSFSHFTWEYFINNQLFRFFNARLPHDYHTGSLYYYLPRVIAYLLPWSIFLPFVFWPLRLKRPFPPLQAFLWTWFLFMLIFFSLSGDKGEYYMVIGIIPLAWLLAQRIENWFEENKSRWLTLGLYLITLLMSVGGVVSLLLYRATREDFATQAAGNKIPITLTTPLTILVVALIAYSALGFYFCRRNQDRPVVPFLLMTGLIVPVLLFFLTVKDRTQYTYSQVTLAKYVQNQYENRMVYLYQDFEDFSSFVFYNREPSIIIDNQSSDLYFGAHLDENKNKFISMNDFLNIAKKNSVYVVLRTDKLTGFDKIVGKDNFCVVQRNGRVLLLSNSNEDCHALIQVGEAKEFSLENLKKDNDAKVAKIRD